MALLDQKQWGGRLFSQGWREGRGGTLPISEPATGERLGEVALASARDVAEAAANAAEAQRGWARTGYEERARILRDAARLLADSAEEATQLLIRETGSIPGKAAFEIGGTQNELYEAAAMPSQAYGQLLPSRDGSRLSMARRIPLGVVGVITPWNFPLLLAMRSVAPALAVGNAVILKADPHTPLSGGVLLARLFEQVGLPAGVLHVLFGDVEPGEALVTDANVNMISFTGSSAVGRRVGELASRNLKKVALELGGNNAFIVLDDADIELASSAGAWGSYLHQGQICMTAGRHLVHEKIADAYIKALSRRADALPVGNPAKEQVALGPMISEEQLQRVNGIVKDTVAAGARLEAGGKHDRLFYRPTVLSQVKPEMRAFAEEIFGPVAPVVTFRSEEEAVELANKTEYGLSAGIHTASIARGLALAGQIKTGLVHVNDQTVDDEAHVPFGGRGASGNGSRFGGSANWEEFTQWQWLTVRDKPAAYPF
jgi:benzaldehyde dehydrogenase (NAD)